MLRLVKLASIGLLFCTVVSARPARAAARDTTTVKFTQPVLASGKVLAPGNYSLERVGPNVVAVTKAGRFIALLQGNPTTRGDQGPSIVTLRTRGAATAELHEWFVTGEKYGIEFTTAPASRALQASKAHPADPAFK